MEFDLAAGECKTCLHGFYKNVTAYSTSECSACPPRSATYHNLFVSRFNCSCDIGYFGPDGMECEPCARGTERLITGAPNCSLCEPGSYKNLTGPGSCLPCAAGSYSEDSGAGLCDLCGPGNFSTEGSSECPPCEAGFFSDDYGAGSCPPPLSRSLSLVHSMHPWQREREFFIDNLLVRIHFIIVMIWWTGLAPWEFEFPFPGSLTSTFQVALHLPSR